MYLTMCSSSESLTASLMEIPFSEPLRLSKSSSPKVPVPPERWRSKALSWWTAARPRQSRTAQQPHLYIPTTVYVTCPSFGAQSPPVTAHCFCFFLINHWKSLRMFHVRSVIARAVQRDEAQIHSGQGEWVWGLFDTKAFIYKSKIYVMKAFY